MLNNKVVIVTGGSSGIGRACAVAFAGEGAKVVVADLREKEGEETLRLVKEAGSDGFFIQTDVSQEVEVKTMVEKTIATYGHLDFACNNAGIEQLATPLTEQTEESFDQIMNINVKGIWLAMKYEIPQMLKNASGAIVNISSVFGLIGFPGVPIYCASKHAIIGLTKSLAVEYASQGIRINAVCPGAIDTEMVRRASQSMPEIVETLGKMHPIARIGTPEEVADAVVWLSSNKSSFITGHALATDGGFVAQ